ncbi:MAG: inorganic phosphate transporter [Francisellaceae bacterium]|nr:inorganic phosphate transporter [Francisellaceae bacterium]
MLKRFLPPQENFFNLFKEAGCELLDATQLLLALFNNLNKAKHYADEIAIKERRADVIAFTIYKRLHSTFITPFDRDDIHHFTTIMDDIIDSIHEVSQRAYIYELKTVPQEIPQIAECAIQCAKLIQTAIVHMETLKKLDDIIQISQEINEIENNAEAFLLSGMNKLFKEEEDIKRLLKLKEIYEDIKEVVDHCQDLANVIKSIALEYS